jgi:hypothetical protein
MDRLARRLVALRPAKNPLVFPLAVATLWALVIGAFATVGRVSGPEDERGSWGEVLGAIAGNFAVFFALCFVISLVLWSRARRSRN